MRYLSYEPLRPGKGIYHTGNDNGMSVNVWINGDDTRTVVRDHTKGEHAYLSEYYGYKLTHAIRFAQNVTR